MQFSRLGAATLAGLAPGSLLMPSSARAQRLPYDPYPWCAVYGNDMSGVTNCGFSTYAQCMATVSGVGGSCEPNQFYNPHRKARRHHRRRYYRD